MYDTCFVLQRIIFVSYVSRFILFYSFI